MREDMKIVNRVCGCAHHLDKGALSFHVDDQEREQEQRGQGRVSKISRLCLRLDKGQNEYHLFLSLVFKEEVTWMQKEINEMKKFLANAPMCQLCCSSPYSFERIRRACYIQPEHLDTILRDSHMLLAKENSGLMEGMELLMLNIE